MTTLTARDMLDNALKRREELRLESEALDQLIATYQNLLGAEIKEQPNLAQLDLYRGKTQRAIQSAQVAEMLDAARRIIVGERRPMKRGELVKKLEASGFKLPGADKNKVFGTNLWRSRKFIAIDGQGYWPADMELPSESRSKQS